MPITIPAVIDVPVIDTATLAAFSLGTPRSQGQYNGRPATPQNASMNANHENKTAQTFGSDFVNERSWLDG